MSQTTAKAQRARVPAGRRVDSPTTTSWLPNACSVLVVEADPDVQAQVARTLRLRGHRVVGTSSGDGALALVSEWSVDLILVSQDLPGRAGVEVTRLLRERRPDAAIVVMATGAERAVCEAARAAGAAACVEKPLSMDTLSPWLMAKRPATPHSALSNEVGVAE